MWQLFSPRLGKILTILVYIAETLGRLGRFDSSKLFTDDRTDDRNDSYSSIRLNLSDAKAAMVPLG